MDVQARYAALHGRALSPQVAGVAAGIVAGAGYLLAQSVFTGLARTGGMAEPLQRIAAILMGPDAAPPPAGLNSTVFGMALIIHFGLAMVFGRLVGTFACGRSLPRAVLAGVAVGLVLYGFNFHVLAPLAFPWFGGSLGVVTAADHVLFGGLAGAICAVLTRRPGS